MGFQEEYLAYEQLKADIKVLDKKLEDKQLEADRKEGRLRNYCASMEKEKADFDELEKTSFAQIIAKIAGNYDEKKEKEYREYIQAKQQYDNAVSELEYARQEVKRVKNELQTAKTKSAEILKGLKNNYSGSEEIRQINAKKGELLCMKKEYEEALSAVRATKEKAKDALKALKDANGASTWDMLGGGIFSDMMKYDSLDKAHQTVLSMKAVANSMKKELADVNIQFEEHIDTIDNGTRFFDIAFDNIFTDLEVKDRIKMNISKIEGYIEKLQALEYRLRDKHKKLEEEIAEFG